MIVVDASAIGQAFVEQRSPNLTLEVGLEAEMHAPYVLDFEVMSLLRGLTLGKRLTVAQALAAWRRFLVLPIRRHELAMIGSRTWELRHQFTTYDAAYLALAEALDAPLYTCDPKLAKGGHRARVVLVANAG